MPEVRPDASPGLIAGVAQATLYRDREEIEQSLVQLLLQFLGARSVSLYRLVREGGEVLAVPRITVAPGADEGLRITRGGAALPLASLPAWQPGLEHRFAQSLPLPDGGVETLQPVCEEDGQPCGMLRIDAPRALDARELFLLGGILQIIRNHLALVDYGQRDTLTGLLNRKTLEGQFDKLRAGAGTHDGPGHWIAIADVDRFKSINDSHGHVFGDEVLLLVSRIIQRALRSGDQVYRFGGEEFAILLQGAPEDAARNAFERLRAAVEQHRFPQIGRVTMSLGWTRIRPQDTPMHAVERADLALYHAKHAGRNRACHYEALVAAGELQAVEKQRESDIELF